MKGSIAVEHVGKRFFLNQARATDLREVFSSRFRARGREAREFWALEDVSFCVRPGETLGIVGHNGSGKSTLLKLLNGILQPTHGTVRVQGRVGALIEVGAGFHADLTGRENVFLNGSILGIPRREIARKFDAIVDFAGIEKFIDTPVKRYSSGMYMRLGFSIAAHVEPDILLIDEVLAVGDQQFQNKCLRRMKEFVAQGGTAVFVSHAMGQVEQLCARCVWLDHGRLLFDGPTEEVVERYMALVAEREDEEYRRNHPEEWAALEAEREAERLRAEAEREAEIRAREEALARRTREMAGDSTRSFLLGVTLRDARGVARTHFQAGEPVRVEIAYRFGRALPDPIFGLTIFRSDGLHMFTTSNYDHELRLDHLPCAGTVALDLPMLALNEGTYRIQLGLFTESSSPGWNERPEDVVEEALVFTVSAGRFANGCVYLPVRWDTPAPPTANAGAGGERIPNYA